MRETKRTKDFRPVKRPGAATRSAKREGLTLAQWERKHYNDPGRVGKEARFISISKKWRHTGPRKNKRTESRSTTRRTERRGR